MRPWRHFFQCLVGFALTFVFGAVFAGRGVTAPASDTLTVGLSESMETLDPHYSLTQSNINVMAHMFDSLLQWDDKFKLVPALATSYHPVNPTTWELTLRSGVQFSDGEQFNADTVKYNVDRIITDKPRVISGGLDILEGAQVVNDRTVRIVTKKPYPSFPRLMVMLYMVPNGYTSARGHAYFAEHPVGTGGYRFMSWRKGDQIVLESWSGSWRGSPKIRRLVFKELPDASTRVSALISGDVDIIQQVPPADMGRIRATTGRLVASVPSTRGIYVGINTKLAPWKDPRVRIALNLAIDKETLIKTILQGGTKPLNGQVVTPEYFGYDPTLSPYPYDLGRAKEMLAAAGVSSASVSIDYPPGRYLLADDIVQYIIAQLGQVGIHAKANAMDFGTFVQNFTSGKLNEMFFYGFSSPTLEADGVLGFYESTNRYSYYNNPVFDHLLNAARTTAGDAQRALLYHRASEVLRQDPPVVFLYRQPLITAMNSRVKGWLPRGDDAVYLYGAWLQP